MTHNKYINFSKPGGQPHWIYRAVIIRNSNLAEWLSCNFFIGFGIEGIIIEDDSLEELKNNNDYLNFRMVSDTRNGFFYVLNEEELDLLDELVNSYNTIKNILNELSITEITQFMKTIQRKKKIKKFFGK